MLIIKIHSFLHERVAGPNDNITRNENRNIVRRKVELKNNAENYSQTKYCPVAAVTHRVNESKI